MPGTRIANRLDTPPTVSIDFWQTLYEMDGFGASETYLPGQSDATMDLLFDQTSGIGLSLMRVGISTTGGTMGTYSNITKAVARGAKILLLPWSALGSQKDSGQEFGGHLLTDQYGAWSDTLAAAPATVVANTSGVTLADIYGVSVQSEPDFNTTAFASMPYSTTEYVNFFKVWAPKVRAASPTTLIVCSDTAEWDNAWTYADATIADATARQYIDRVAGHQYDGMSSPTGNWTGRKWMTEMSTFDTYDATMTNGLIVAGFIHDAIATGLSSAWCYWWMARPSQADNENLYDTVRGAPKRYYVVGQWSKFVRPGYMRVGITGTSSGVNMTAFLKVSTGAFCIVAVNTNSSAVVVPVALGGLTAASVTPHLTSASSSLAAQSAIPAGKSFSMNLPALSVTSFVGTGT